MKVKVLYFASLKERLLKGEDTVELPEDVKTVAKRFSSEPLCGDFL